MISAWMSKPLLLVSIIVAGIAAAAWLAFQHGGFNQPDGTTRLFTLKDLRREKELGHRIVLSIAGQVFDVSQGDRFYGPQGTYHIFSFRDASRAFSTGAFSPPTSSEDEAETFRQEWALQDTSDFKPSECLAVKSWLSFFQNHKVYSPLGTLADSYYYDDKGHPTEANHRFIACALEGEKEKELFDLKKQKEKCSMDWNLATKTRQTVKRGGRLSNAFAFKNRRRLLAKTSCSMLGVIPTAPCASSKRAENFLVS
jgi:Cytochrome b5-like Heme/Steroid binding domain